MTELKTTSLSEAVRHHLDQWLLRYPPNGKQSGVFEALRIVQEENKGFLTTELMDAVADYLSMPKIAVYEIATFYSLYHLSPVGNRVIDVCTNISCALNGADNILAHLQKRLGVNTNETTQDGDWTLREVECLGACIAAPVCQIGKKYYESLTIEKVDTILDQFKNQDTNGAHHGK
jgi:NADH-quinone oxidoreductase subunit E